LGPGNDCLTPNALTRPAIRCGLERIRIQGRSFQMARNQFVFRLDGLPMIAEISAALAGANHAVQLATAAVKMAKDVEVKAAVSALQDEMLDLQSKLFSAHAKFEELLAAKKLAEDKLADLENWNKEAARYQLVELAKEINAYGLKPDCANGEPHHNLCPNCFQNRKKSIIHRERAGSEQLVCDNCSFKALPKIFPAQARAVSTGYNWAMRGM
jgi:hypothetical protein